MDEQLQGQLRKFLADDNHYVAQAAQHVLQAGAAYHRGELTADEFRELAHDVIDTKRAAIHASEIDKDARIDETLDMLVQLLPKVVGLVAKGG